MSELTELRSIWEGLAETDPLWAILSDPRRQGGKWDPAEFFATGEREIEAVRAFLRELGQPIPDAGPALDFGCGVGRLTQPIARYWAPAVGVDISQGMVDQARRLNRQGDRCEFVCNDQPTLPFPTDHFNFTYSNIVLQHVPTALARGYVAEFVRTLRPGGLAVFQLCDVDKGRPPVTWKRRITDWRVKLALGTRVRRLLGRGRSRPAPAEAAKAKFEYSMNPTPESAARPLIEAAGGRVVDVRFTNATDADFNGSLQFLSAEPQFGYVSKLYTVTK